VLDRHGVQLDATLAREGAAIALGPEGGIDTSEQTLLRDSGWRSVTVAPATLRFETAGIAAAAIIRAGTMTVNPEV
jgi:RsmE family RNA methyltransferase